jgi:hypothetical protein
MAGRRNRNPRASRSTNNGANQNPKTPLMPSGVNNKATMPRKMQSYTVEGEEVLQVINVASGSTAGQLIYNSRISHDSAARLSLLSKAFQRVRWHNVTINCVPVNGSVVQGGYNFGFIEDPEIEPPISGTSEVIPFMTALRGTSVRQNWVQSQTGQTVKLNELPEMYSVLGTDQRRYYIGRALLALTGDVTIAASFQILLKYRVTLMVPRVVVSGGVIPGETYTFPSALIGYTTDAGGVEHQANSSSTVPATGVYTLADGSNNQLLWGENDGGRILNRSYVKGFRVTTAGGTGNAWGTNTQAILDDDSFLDWPSNDGTRESDWFLPYGDVEFDNTQRIFPAGAIFNKVT